MLRIVKTKGIDLGLGYGLVWLVFEIKKVGFFCLKKKMKKEESWKVAKRGRKRVAVDCGEFPCR